MHVGSVVICTDHTQSKCYVTFTFSNTKTSTSRISCKNTAANVFIAPHRLIWWICVLRYPWQPLVLLCSSSRGDLIILRSQLSRYGSRSFSVWVPTAWNSLAVAVRDLSSSSTYFCGYLKTELFSRAYGIIPSWHVHDSFTIRLDKHKLPFYRMHSKFQTQNSSTFQGLSQWFQAPRHQ